MILLGRQRIYTDTEEITRENIIPILKKAYAKHQHNVTEMQYLINFDRGIQPLVREKAVRKDIDIRVTDNIFNYANRFHVGYFWSSPILLGQRGDNEIHKTDGTIDSQGISALNEMMKNGDKTGAKDQKVGASAELLGIGHKLVDIKTVSEIKKDRLFWNKNGQYVGALYKTYALDSRYAFIVYLDAPGEKEVLGVSFSKSGGKLRFTCWTETAKFSITSWKVTNEESNILEGIPIVEYDRSVDLTGCAERVISECNSLNVLVSDFTNDVAQRTQEMWWGDNVDFDENENGEVEKPKSGDWVLTNSVEGRKAQIQPLTSTFDSGGTLDAINRQRNWILQKCYVPLQFDSNGGGSTGIATGMYSGWSETEIDAMQKEQLVDSAKRKELSLILKAISIVPDSILPEDSPIRQVHVTDVEFHYERRRDYDINSQLNSFATAVSHGIHGRHALGLIKALPDIEQTWMDSKELIEAYQKSAFIKNAEESGTVESKRTMQDESDQSENSPFIG